MYRRDRAKGGGSLIAYFSRVVPSKRLKLPKTYRTLEAIAVECSIGRKEILFLALYRPPKQVRENTGSKYLQNVEEEMNDICRWACLQTQTIVVFGDLNMDRLNPDRGEGKILRDLEEVYNLSCLITEPTRVTIHSQALLDVLLTNTPELFKNCGVYTPEISDHYLIYGQMTEKVCKHKPKTMTFRQTKNADFELLNQELMNAPWQVGDIFTSTDDQYDYWKGLFEYVVDQHAPVKRKRVREKEVAETLATYFTNVALDIGGDHVNNLMEEDHSEHSSVRSIREAY